MDLLDVLDAREPLDFAGKGRNNRNAED